MNIGKNLKAIRKLRGLTQVQIAKETGISQETLACYESGIRNPSLENIIKLAKVLGVSYDELLGVAPESLPASQAIRSNTRTAKMVELFESLKPAQQRDLIKQTAALAGDT